jgi:hypothetical protein
MKVLSSWILAFGIFIEMLEICRTKFFSIVFHFLMSYEDVLKTNNYTYEIRKIMKVFELFIFFKKKLTY